MSLSKARVTLVCVAASVGLAACGTTAKPLAGTPGVAHLPGTRGKIDDPRTDVHNHVACLRANHLQVILRGQTDIQVGAGPGGPFVHFTPTAGMAQGDQISGQLRFAGAEVIGSALVWPNQGSDAELKTIETCLAVGVSG
jgi:hypothetical protein